MTEDKKYYWIKLKTDFFNQDAIDFLMSQDNGCEYIVLYQMLCLQTANTKGVMAKQVGEIIIPYDAKKISINTKYFDIDTVTVALELYKRLGLIYQEQDGTLCISDYDEMIGSETKWAEKKRNYRKNKALIEGQGEGQIEDKKRTLSDKSIEIRDKSIEKDIDIEKDIKEKGITKVIPKKKGKNIPPTLEEVKEYCIERNNGIDAERFYYYYQSNGWKVGRNTMKDWHSAMVTWERNQKENKYSNYKTPNKAEQKQEHLVGMLDNFIMQEDEND